MMAKSSPTYKLYTGNCTEIIKDIPSQSIDAVITDPPYPYIKRDYGYWEIDEWWAIMVDNLIPEIRRVLKPSGSAVFVLQANMEKQGSTRGWLWEFMAWVCREWNLIQDVWWWNVNALPNIASTTLGLLRSSIKACVWAGEPDCYRNQESVLWEESQENKKRRASSRVSDKTEIKPSGHRVNQKRMYKAAVRRGGVTPFNVLPFGCGYGQRSSGAHGHGAGTPLQLADWWVRYICPEEGTVLDPFNGAGTMGIAAIQNRCDYIGIEKEPEYVDISHERIDEALKEFDQLRFL